MKTKWETKRLGEVCDLIGGGTPSKANSSYYSGNILWVTVRDMRSDYVSDTECKISRNAVEDSATNVIPKGNVIIATRVGLGKVCLLEKAAAINQDLKGVIPKKAGAIDPKYLFYWFKSVGKTIIENGTGATVQGVKIPFISGLPFPTPPISEQKHIVAVLDEAFAAIAKAKENAEKNLANARELFGSYLRNVFSNPKYGWHERTLGEVCAILDRKRRPITKRDRVPGPYPYYGATGVLDYVHEYIFDEKLVLIGEDGAKWGAGENTAFLAEGKYWVNNHAHVIRPDRAIVLDKWLIYFLNFSDLTKYVTGLTVPKLNQEKLRGIVFPLPPLADQKKYILELDTLLNKINQLDVVYRQKIANLEELNKSILQKAFSGELIRANS